VILGTVLVLLLVRLAPALALPGAAGTEPLGAGLPAGSAPAAVREAGFEPRLGEVVPLDVPFRDEEGRDIRLRELLGEKPAILTFAYAACPMLCPLVLNGLASALRAVPLTPGKDFEIVNVSLDPRETPDEARKKKNVLVNRYGRRETASGWRFLTGEETSIRRLAAAVGFRYAVDGRGQYAHAAGLFVLAPGGRVSRALYGVEFAPRDLRLALVEASEGRIGTLGDRLLLLCYRYDPESGTYAAWALASVRIAGAVTVVALGGFLLTMWRRERRRGVGP
jgi:protein SCO1/2